MPRFLPKTQVYKRMQRLGTLTLLILAAFAFSRPLSAKTVEATTLQFPSYGAFMQKVLTLLGNARQSIWLATKQINDGNLASALYMAKYRQAEVYALLGTEQLAKDSQYRQLQAYKIPVALTQNSFFSDSPSLLQIDGTLHLLSTSFDKLSQKSTYFIKRASKSQLEAFITKFKQHFLSHYKASAQTAVLKPPAINAAKAQGQEWQSNQSYRYKNKHTKRPKDIAKRLPKTPKWKKKD